MRIVTDDGKDVGMSPCTTATFAIFLLVEELLDACCEDRLKSPLKPDTIVFLLPISPRNK